MLDAGRAGARGGQVTKRGARAVFHGKTWEKLFFVGVGFPSSCLALTRPRAIPRKAPTPRDLEGLERAPRSPAWAQGCASCTHAPPACPAAENARKDVRYTESDAGVRLTLADGGNMDKLGAVVLLMSRVSGLFVG